MIRQEGVEDVISIICNLFDLVYRKVFYIWIKSILGDHDIALYGCVLPCDSSENTFQNITGQSDYTIIDMQLNRNATDNEVNTIRQMAGTDVTFSDERMGNESTRGIYYCMWLFIYGFLAVIAFITVFNIINSPSVKSVAGNG